MGSCSDSLEFNCPLFIPVRITRVAKAGSRFYQLPVNIKVDPDYRVYQDDYYNVS